MSCGVYAEPGARRFLIAPQAQWGTKALANSAAAAALRRSRCDITPADQQIQSAERRTTMKAYSMRKGMQQTGVSVNAPLFQGVHTDLIAGVLRRAMTAGGTVTGQATIASGVVTFADQNPITGKVHKGRIVRVAGATQTALNNVNLFVSAVTTTTVTLIPLTPGLVIADQAAPSPLTITVAGGETYLPDHPEDRECILWTLEDQKLDVETSRLVWDLVFAGASITISPDQEATLSLDGGLAASREFRAKATGLYFTADPADEQSDALSGTPGAMLIDGELQAANVGFSIQIQSNIRAPAVNGSDKTPQIISTATQRATGSVSIMHQDEALIAAFEGETNVELLALMETPGAAPRSGSSIYLPRVRLFNPRLEDTDDAVVETYDFEALEPTRLAGLTEGHVQYQDLSFSA